MLDNRRAPQEIVWGIELESRLLSEERGGGRSRDLEQKIKNLEEKMGGERREKEKLQELNKANLGKIKKLMEEISKMGMEKGRLEEVRSTIQFRLEETQGHLKTTRQTVESLNKTIQEMKNSQVYSNVKNLQTQLHSFQERNSKLAKENQELVRANKLFKESLDSRAKERCRKDSTEGSSVITDLKGEPLSSAAFELGRLKAELAKSQS